jgi:hypothetical protein
MSGDSLTVSVFLGSLAMIAATLTYTLVQAAPVGKDSGRPVAQSTDPKQATRDPSLGTDQSPLVIKVAPAPDAKEKTAEDARERKEKLDLDTKLVGFNKDLAFYTEVLAWVAAFQFAALIVQAYFLLRTVRGSEHTAKMQLRAYVFIDSFDVVEYLIGAPPVVRLIVKNFGQTPAYEAVYVSDISFGKEFVANPIMWTGKQKTRAAIGPGASVRHLVTGTTPLDEDTAREHQAGHVSMFIYGMIQYRDAFNKTRATPFRLQRDSMQSLLVYSEVGNHPSQDD